MGLNDWEVSQAVQRGQERHRQFVREAQVDAWQAEAGRGPLTWVDRLALWWDRVLTRLHIPHRPPALHRH